MNEMKKFMELYTAMLPVSTSISYTEAEKRAGEFLSAMARISDWKHILNSEKIKLVSIQTLTFAQEMSKQTAKTVTENKMNAESSDDYVKAREELEAIDNDISYLRAHYDLFMAAHVFYRQMAKGEAL